MIDRFISSCSDGFLHSNMFTVVIRPPFTTGEEFLRKLQDHAVSTSFPFFTYSQAIMTANNQNNKFVSGFDYEPITITFRNDSNGYNLKFFTFWLELIKPVGGRFNFKNRYAGSIIIALLDKTYKIVQMAELVNAYPTSIENTTLDYNSSNSLLEIPVIFNYDYIKYYDHL